jgi:hypothetical protein
MFLVKAGTVIQIYAPFGKFGSKNDNPVWFDTAPWKPYTTKEDKLYDKHEVWDVVAVYNEREDVPEWAKRNIMEHRKTVIRSGVHFALVDQEDIEFLN